MAKFNFKFESVKKIKETLEKKTQKELSLIELEVSKINEEIKNLFITKKLNKAKVTGNGTIKVNMLHYLQNYELFIDNKIEELQKRVIELLKAKEKKIIELSDRTKETKMFEKLKEKHLIDYVNVQKKIEQIEIDEIATKQFVREINSEK